MLYKYNYIHSHVTVKLNKHLLYFFRKLRAVNNISLFNPYTNYFHADFVTHLNGAPELRAKFESFFDAFKILSAANRTTVLLKFVSAQNIKGLIEDIGVNGNLYKLKSLPASLRKPTNDLFTFMYPGTLNRGDSLNDHYKEIYKEVFEVRKLKVCPFCGMEPLLPPHIRKQDYDHILKQESYPFTIVNMKNLVPMGRDCNQIFKGRKDSIYNPQTGNRRVFAYPFERSYDIKINLATSVLPSAANKSGTWNIAFSPFDDFVETWDSVFDIKIRYSDMILSRHFDDWMLQFEETVKKDNKRITSRNRLKREFRDVAKIYLGQPLLEYGIVKGALFKFLSNCNDNLFYDSIIKKINN